MTTQPTSPDIARQTLSLLESLIEVCVEKALARQTTPKVERSLWVSAKEAAEILGEGYTVTRVKQLGNAGEVIADRKDTDGNNAHYSQYVFLRSSLYEYSARRVFEIDQAKP